MNCKLNRRLVCGLLLMVAILVLAGCAIGPVKVSIEGSSKSNPCPASCPFIGRDDKYYKCACTDEFGKGYVVYKVDEQTHIESASAPSVAPSERSIWFDWYVAPKWNNDFVYYFQEKPPFEGTQDAFGRMTTGAWAYKFEVDRQCVARTKVWVPVGTEGYGHKYGGSASFCR